MLESLTGLLPSSIPVIDVPHLVKSSWNTFSERKVLVQNALAEVRLPHLLLIKQQAINEQKSVRARRRHKKFSQIALENATSYEDWARAALDLDALEGRCPSILANINRQRCLERRPQFPSI